MSAPSGTGKTTVIKELLHDDPCLLFSTSVTTRQPRPNEKEGIDYYFIDEQHFQQLQKNNAFLEHATVFGYSYGTLKSSVEQLLLKGYDILLDVDWQGAQQIRHNTSHNNVSIFLLPPSMHDIEHRLRLRLQNTEKDVQQRLHTALEEITHCQEYDYVLINDTLEHSIEHIKAIIKAERLKRFRQEDLKGFITQQYL